MHKAGKRPADIARAAEIRRASGYRVLAEAGIVAAREAKSLPDVANEQLDGGRRHSVSSCR